MPDYDDCLKLKELASKYNHLSDLKNKAIFEWMSAERNISIAIARNGISDKLSWKKQIISLMSIKNNYIEDYTTYSENRYLEKVYSNTLKSIENEINVLKKIHEVTPTGEIYTKKGNGLNLAKRLESA